MLRRSTWIVLGIFVLAVAFTMLFQRYQSKKTSSTVSATATPTAPAVFLYNLSESQVKDIKILNNKGDYIDLYRDPDSSSWAIEGVPVNKADTAKIKSISDALLALQVQETLADTTISLATVGLETPAYTITLTTSLNIQSVTYVGMPTAIGTGYYIRQNDGQIMIVDKSSLDMILDALKEPPLLPTATPETTPTVTSAPSEPVGQATPTP